MSTRETWYVLEDGSCADPREVVSDANGVMRDKRGVAVALGPHGPRSSGVDVEAERAKSAAGSQADDRTKAESGLRGRGGAAKAKDMKPDEQKPGYVTRETKAD